MNNPDNKIAPSYTTVEYLYTEEYGYGGYWYYQIKIPSLLGDEQSIGYADIEADYEMCGITVQKYNDIKLITLAQWHYLVHFPNGKILLYVTKMNPMFNQY